MHIVVPAGGIGGARFLRGLLAAFAGGTDAGHDVTVIGNTGDDITLFGLRVCPDLDTVMYTLGGGIHEEQGWGRSDETFVVKEELAAYGVGPAWFGLGDRDLATHVVRTQMLDAGLPAQPGHRGAVRPLGAAAGVRLLPMSDDRVETHVVIDDPRRRAGDGPCTSRSTGCGCTRCPTRTRSWPSGPRTRSPARGARGDRRPRTSCCCRRPTRSSASARSWPCPASATRWSTTAAPVVGLSPIVGGAPVRGMADQVLAAIGVETSAAAVALHYGAARRRAARRLAGRHRDADAVAGGRGGRHRLPGGAAADDRRRRGRRDGPRGARPRRASCAAAA